MFRICTYQVGKKCYFFEKIRLLMDDNIENGDNLFKGPWLNYHKQ